MKLRAKLTAIVIALTAVTFAPAHANTAPKIGIAYEIGGRGDRSFNDAAAAGLDKAMKKFTFTVDAVVTDGTSADRDKRLRSLITKGCSPIIVVGSGYVSTVQDLAIEFPNTQFAILNDATIDALNVTSIVFADTQGAFLAGFSAALVSKTGKVAMIASPSQADLYQNGFAAGVLAAKKNVTPFVKYAAGSASLGTKQAMDMGADVLYVTRVGSSSDVFDEIVARNISKAKAKNYKAVGMISIEPDQFVTVTAATKKYLYATVVKRVDIAMYDVISKTVNNQQFLDVLDAKAGIYGHRYSINGGGISITTFLPALISATSQINSGAALALKIPN